MLAAPPALWRLRATLARQARWRGPFNPVSLNEALYEIDTPGAADVHELARLLEERGVEVLDHWGEQMSIARPGRENLRVWRDGHFWAAAYDTETETEPMELLSTLAPASVIVNVIVDLLARDQA